MELDKYCENNLESGLTTGPEEALQREIEKCKLLKVERLQLRDKIKQLKKEKQVLIEEIKTLQKPKTKGPHEAPKRFFESELTKKTNPRYSNLTAINLTPAFLLSLAVAWLVYSFLTI